MGILLFGLSSEKSKLLCVQALPLMTIVVIFVSFFFGTSFVFLVCGGDEVTVIFRLVVSLGCDVIFSFSLFSIVFISTSVIASVSISSTCSVCSCLSSFFVLSALDSWSFVSCW